MRDEAVSPSKLVFYRSPVWISSELPATITEVFVVFLSYSMWCRGKILDEITTVHFKIRTCLTFLTILPPRLPIYIYTGDLTPRRRNVLEKITFAQPVQKYYPFVEFGNSLPCSQQPTTGPYPDLLNPIHARTESFYETEYQNSWEAGSRLAGQDILPLWWKLNVYSSVHKKPPLDSAVRHLNSDHIPLLCSF
jgi:hypothetical protein